MLVGGVMMKQLTKALKARMDRLAMKPKTPLKLSPHDDDKVWIMNHTHFAQEWAIATHKEKKDKGEEIKEIP